MSAGTFETVVNPLAGPLPELTEVGAGVGAEAGGGAPPTQEVLAFHRRLPGYGATPLLSVPALAERLGVADLLVKCESTRFGLPAFKMLGASWAAYRAVSERLHEELGEELGAWADVDELAARLKGLLPFSLATATDGNHGRAVARMARLLGFGARIFVPEGTSPGRIEAIAGEGAEVVVVAGGYEAAVALSAQEAGPRCLVISDTSWPGYTDVPRWVVEGYSTLFWEIDEALAAGGRRPPDVVVVPLGVGALGAAAVVHFLPGARGGPVLLGVEPSDAACVTASCRAGEPVMLEGPQRSIMAGLNCATPSPVAWPLVSRGFTGFVTVDDDWARQALRDLAAVGIEAGETGAAPLAGLTALQREGRDSPLARVVPPGASVLLLMTEGASDRASWRRILGVEVVGPPG